MFSVPSLVSIFEVPCFIPNNPLGIWCCKRWKERKQTKSSKMFALSVFAVSESLLMAYVQTDIHGKLLCPDHVETLMVPPDDTGLPMLFDHSHTSLHTHARTHMHTHGKWLSYPLHVLSQVALNMHLPHYPSSFFLTSGSTGGCLR